jgi:hypothetical protein
MKYIRNSEKNTPVKIKRKNNRGQKEEKYLCPSKSNELKCLQYGV